MAKQKAPKKKGRWLPFFLILFFLLAIFYLFGYTPEGEQSDNNTNTVAEKPVEEQPKEEKAEEEQKPVTPAEPEKEYTPPFEMDDNYTRMQNYLLYLDTIGYSHGSCVAIANGLGFHASSKPIIYVVEDEEKVSNRKNFDCTEGQERLHILFDGSNPEKIEYVNSIDYKLKIVKLAADDHYHVYDSDEERHLSDGMKNYTLKEAIDFCNKEYSKKQQ